MISTIRQCAEFYQQTRVSLMYASRAKNIKNRSVVNRNVIGDTGIHAVTTEIERLRGRLDERTSEFERLRALQMQDASENLHLKKRLQELNAANESEKKQLEQQMSHVLHSQAGQLAVQRQKIASLQRALQDELAISQNRIAEQEKEIKWLKTALHESSKEAQQPKEQLEKMQKMLDGWQSQAGNTQKELEDALKVVETLRARVTSLTEELKTATDSQKSLKLQVTDTASKLVEAKAALQLSVAEREQLSAKSLMFESTTIKLSEQISEMKSDMEQKGKLYNDLNKHLAAAQDSLKIQSAQKDTEIAALREESKRHQEILVREKAVLTAKLNKVVSNLESQMSEALGEAKKKITDTDNRRKAAEDKLRQAELELSDMRGKLASLHSQNEEAIREKDHEMQITLKALKSEQGMNGSLAEKLLALTKENGSNLKDLDQAKEISRLNKEQIADLEKTLKETSLKHARDILHMTTDHNKSIQEALEQQRVEYDKRESHLISLTAAQIKTELEEKINHYKAEMSRCAAEYSDSLKEKEAAIEHLRETHQITISGLELKHKKELESTKATVEKRMAELHSENITSIESAHILKISEIVRQHESEKHIYTEKELTFLREIDDLELRYNEEVERLSAAMKQAEMCADLKLTEVKTKYKEKFQESLIQQKESFDKEKLECAEKLKVELDRRTVLEQSIITEREEHEKVLFALREDIDKGRKEFREREIDICRNEIVQLRKIWLRKSILDNVRNSKTCAFMKWKVEVSKVNYDEKVNKIRKDLLKSKLDRVLVNQFTKRRRGSLSGVFRQWKDFVLNGRICDKDAALSISLRTRVKSTVRWLLMNKAYEKRLWAFRNWSELLSLSKKEDAVKALMTDNHKVIIEDLQDSLRHQAATEISAIKDKCEYEIRVLSESKNAEVAKLRDEIVSVQSKMEAELTNLSVRKNAKIENLSEEITRLQKVHTEDMTKALENQLSQLLESHKAEFDSLRKDKESLVNNYERQFLSMKEANDSKADLLRAQFEDSLENLKLQSEQIVSDLTAKLDKKQTELKEKSDTVDALNKKIEELSDSVSRQLVDIRLQYQNERDALSLTHAEEAARLTDEICSIRNNFAKEMSEYKSVYESRIENLLSESDERRLEAIETEVKMTEKRCKDDFDTKLSNIKYAHEREMENFLLSNEEVVAKKNAELETCSITINDLNIRLEGLEQSLTLCKESHTNELRALSIEKDIALSELTVKSQNRCKEIEDRCNSEIDTLQEKLITEIATLKQTYEERLVKVANDQTASVEVRNVHSCFCLKKCF